MVEREKEIPGNPGEGSGGLGGKKKRKKGAISNKNGEQGPCEVTMLSYAPPRNIAVNHMLIMIPQKINHTVG